jgi:hypothetical protein
MIGKVRSRGVGKPSFLPIFQGTDRRTYAALATLSSFASSESGIVHDHDGPGQHQIAALACIVVRIGAQNLEYAGTTQGDKAVGRSSCGDELSSRELSSRWPASVALEF